MGLYRDNAKENGNYYLGFLIFPACPHQAGSLSYCSSPKPSTQALQDLQVRPSPTGVHKGGKMIKHPCFFRSVQWIFVRLIHHEL